MDNRKKNMSLRVKILLTGVVSLCVLIICACAIIGFQVYQVNIRQYDQTSSQQFLLIEQTIDLFMQNNKNTVKMLAEHPSVRAADTSLNNYTVSTQDVMLKNVPKGQIEQEMVTLSGRNGEDLPVLGMTLSVQALIRGSVYGISKQRLPAARRS